MKKQMLISLVLAAALAVSMTINIVLWATWPKDADRTDEAAKDMIGIETPYGTVKFPASFEGVRHQAGEQDGVYSVSFFYSHGEEDIEVFAVHFGNEEKGTLIGHIDKDNILVPFTVTSCEGSVDEMWEEQEQERFRALMMAVNDVIASVEAWDNFLG
ncbi:MAG: hypothetical protein E7553_02955 [Ruminococcaceae bacterium]|nr:hypothetical protein [Oscillospiraceae bacterium]